MQTTRYWAGGANELVCQILPRFRLGLLSASILAGLARFALFNHLSASGCGTSKWTICWLNAMRDSVMCFSFLIHHKYCQLSC